MATQYRTGWVPPTPAQQIRALRGAHPEAGDSILANVVPAPTSDLSAYTCDLDQFSLGSCTANGIAQMVYVAMRKADFEPADSTMAFILARLWLYYGERYLEGTVMVDAGANIGDGMAILAGKGIPREDAWPYDVEKFTQDPGPSVDRMAYDSRGAIGVNYHPITSTGNDLLTDIEKALSVGFAVVFGSPVSEAFCSQQPSGVIMPNSRDVVAGGHCRCIVGHDRANRRLKVKNSWSNQWGDPTAGPGCSWDSYDWATDPTWGYSDIWILNLLPGGLGQ